jgi:predicted DNA-binding transcriptional regulator YafY
VPGQLSHLAAIVSALWEDEGLVMEYIRGDNSQVERHVFPLGLVLKAGQWYLVGAAVRNIRVFRVSRMRSVERTNETFIRPADFDLQAFWTEWLADFETGKTSVPVRVRVVPAFADELPRYLGEDLRVRVLTAEPGPDGRLELDVVFDSLVDARRLLLGLGPDVEVVAPASLRRNLAAAAAQVAHLYPGGGGSRAGAGGVGDIDADAHVESIGG